MTKKMFVGGTVIALAVALTAGGLMASNMGFKLNYTLNAAAVGVSNSVAAGAVSFLLRMPMADVLLEGLVETASIITGESRAMFPLSCAFLTTAEDWLQ